MNVQAVIYANDHIETLRRESAQRRMVDTLPRTSLRQRLASIVGTLRSALTEPIVASGSVTPAVH
jgi:hypothetical protein